MRTPFLFALNAANSFLPAKNKKKSLRRNLKSKKPLKRRKRNLLRSRRAVSRSKQLLMMAMMATMTISARSMKAVNAKVWIKN